MTELMALSVVTGVLCGAWTFGSGYIGLIAWAGFAGCTTYFATGKHGKEGFLVTVRQNLFGVACGMAIIILSNMFPFPASGGIFSALITFVMCIAGRISYLSFIPGTFVGSFSTFAANGDWKPLVISIVLGAALGVACDFGGKWFFNKTSSKEKEKMTL